ncbi:MAG: DUF6377 domain-containing protein [Bacteroidota bacterium]|uniref:DUF6377 domain-containing protein n=1 Tax=Salegentibacter flavus TaxID=287099 RepID=A0A1I5AEB4_9FLAO|nr:DUF6377 domain-containing protein [Salegentibacter flavus]SFN60794.1 hypothetical protein SAMN05660413_01821 [Salegentibacter flavus]
MKFFFNFLISCFFFFSISLFGQEEETLNAVLENIEKAEEYDREKVNRIENLRNELNNVDSLELQKRYELNLKLFNEYRIFKQDSAFKYGLRIRSLADQLDSLPLKATAVVNLADVSVSAGMYKEALDFLETISPEEIPENTRSLYFGLAGRLYNEMAEYNALPFFALEYLETAQNYREQALRLAEEGTFFNSFLKGFIEYKHGDPRAALQIFESLLEQELGLRDQALVHYSMGDIYFQLGEKEKAIFHFSKASIADIRTSTKETLAMIRLAELTFERGKTDMASAFIRKANEDASFYGAQQRKIRVGAILPIIEEQIVQKVEKQREALYRQNVIVTFLLIFVMGLAVIIFYQVIKMKKARKTIEEAHHTLQETNKRIILVNEEVESKNQQLNRLNAQLQEANKIKEEYIGFFFTQDADIFEKFREFKLKIEEDLNEENLKRLKYTISSLNLKREKEKLMRNFDEAFIKLFPNFIEEFNSLLKPEEQITLKKGQLLNKELRIFALIRLGIKHNEIIAQILGYSVNSIYTYKTKIRKKSRLDKKDFDDKLIENTTLKL